MPPTSPDAVSNSVLVCALMFLDPRRWFGALIALVGVLISIIAHILPASLVQRVSHPPVAPLRPLPAPRRPSPVPLQPSIMATARASAAAVVRARPRTAGDAPFSPHVTFLFGPHPRSVSGPILSSRLSTNSESSPPNPLPDPSTPPRSLSPVPSDRSLPPADPPYEHPDGLPSLDSLDLASSEASGPSSQHSHAQSKRSFRIQIPKLGKEKSAKGKDKDKPASDEGWRGTKAFAVKRSNTIATSPDMAHEPGPAPVPSRRRFSIFSREASFSKEKDAASKPAVPPVPPLPSPATLERMVASLPAAHSSPPSPPTTRTATLALEDMVPLSKTTTPPARPARTDPYKAYGVPVPGSERARAFLKAEKEWIRSERERRGQGQTQTQTQVQKAGEGEGEGESERGRGRGRKMCVRKEGSKETCAAAADEADVEDAAPDVDEFGVLPPPPPEQGSLKRTWTFGRRSSDFTGARPERRRERGSVDKVEVPPPSPPPPPARKRSKSREAKKGKAFRAKERTAKGRDRGYTSDSQVPSLTYKFMA